MTFQTRVYFWEMYFTKETENSLPSFHKLIEAGQGEKSCIEQVLQSSAFPVYITPFIMLPQPPTPFLIRGQVRQYNNNSSLELPHYVYISILLKYSLQKFGFGKWTQKL